MNNNRKLNEMQKSNLLLTLITIVAILQFKYTLW